MNLKKTDILTSFKEILYNSTGQGLVKVLSSKYKTVRVIWFFTLLTSSSMCFFLITENVLNYFKYEVNTKTRKITQIPSPFPTIILCSKNMFQTDFALDFVKKVIKNNNLTNIFNENSNEGDIQEVLFLAASNTLSSNLTDEQRKRLSLPLSTLLRSCSFDDKPCGEADFFWKYNRFLGNCFIFNAGINGSDLKETKQAGN